MEKKINDQALQVKKTRGFYGKLDKIGSFVRKWAPAGLGVLVTVVTVGKIKPKK